MVHNDKEESTTFIDTENLIEKEISMPRDKRKMDNVIEAFLIIIFCALVAIIFLYRIIPDDIRYWVIVGFTIAYFILLVTKLVWDRLKSG